MTLEELCRRIGLQPQVRSRVLDIFRQCGPQLIAPYLAEFYHYSRMTQAAELGCQAVCFDGSIDFYGRSGFTYASSFGIRCHGVPEGEEAPSSCARNWFPGIFPA